MTEPPLLSIKDLTVSFPDDDGPRLRAVDRVSLEIHAGETTAVVGESGSGKSVTAMSILRLLQSPPARYESGTIDFTRRNGEHADLLALRADELRRIRGDEIAMIFQEPMTSLNPVMTIGDQIIEAIRLHRAVTRRQAADLAVHALAEVGIRDPRARLRAYPHEFSGGMRQRVMIAIALACQPRRLIADEPTTALDVTVQAQILELIRDLKRDRSLGVLLITHDLGLVANHADHICVMYAGRVVETAPADRILDNPRHPYTRALLASAPSVGDQRRRLMTLDELTTGPERFSITIGGEEHRAWWPRGTPAAASEALIAVEPGHWIRVWSPGAQEMLSTSGLT